MQKNYPHFNFFYLLFFLFFTVNSFSQYCNSYGNTTHQTSVTLVNFNTINNLDLSTKTTGYSDFTAQSTTVVRGSSYNLTVNVNTDGNFIVGVIAWIDWNQDGIFNNTDEEYNIGSRQNVLNGSTTLSPLPIIIPATANVGATRMRVSARYYYWPTACGTTNFDGEVEDYTIQVASITTGTISPTTFCAGSTVSIPYTITGTFNTGNIFTAQLSNASGSFASPVNIGTLSSIAAGTISGTIPIGTPSGTGYRIRVVSSNPAVTGSVNGSDLTVNAIIGNNTFDFTTGNYGTLSATAAENANATLTAPAGKYFLYVGFASYGTPTGAYPNFAIGGSCHSITSQSVTEGYLLGNNTATIPATNVVFGDPCVGTVKRLYVQASHAAPICSGTSPGLITGLTPTGGNGAYTYLWQSSTTSATSGFGNAVGTITARDYTPGALTQTTWFRRTVTSGGCSNTSSVILMKVTPLNTVATGVNRTACINTAITSITLATTGATGATFSGFPAGVTGAWAGNVVTISGTPTVSGTFNYTVTTTGGCLPATTTGIITVTPLNTIAAGINRTACINTAIASITLATTGATGATFAGLPAGVTGSWASNTVTISGTPTVSGTFNYTVTTTGGCLPATATGTITVNSLPTAPTTTGAQICIGFTATLSASGAVAGSVYKWYSAATGGTLLKTSTNNTDNTYTTLGPPTNLTATTNYWVSILNASGCESARTMVTATMPALSPDSQITAGNNTWIGHVYDGNNESVPYTGNFTNYYGTYTEAETFDQGFGGNTTCFSINSITEGNRSIYTETFSVRYRMNSTKPKGLYVVDLGSDDGSRLQVDGSLVYDNWFPQSFGSGRPNVLIGLNGNSSLVYDFYENAGGNQVRFNNIRILIENTLSSNITQNICKTNSGTAISGDIFGTLPTGITTPGTGYQWAYSTSPSGPFTNNITGATAANFTPSGSTPEFSAGGTFYVVRKAILSSTNNDPNLLNPPNLNPYIATNNSNVATITIISNNTWTGAVSPDWNNATNWSCGGIPTITTDVIIPAGTPNDPIIYASPDANGYANKIELETGATLTIEDNYIEIDGNLRLNGKIDLEGESQLLQGSGSVFEVASTGSIEIDQQGTSDNFRYNYWGSPVNSAVGTSYTIAGVLRDGTFPNSSFFPVNKKTIDFGAAFTYADINIAPIDNISTAIKLSTYWMYKFVNSGNGYGGWTSVGKDGTLKVGEGFTLKGSNTTLAEQNYTFVGKPNNGDINLDITAGRQYLIGNPYPSAVDARKFIKDNISIIADSTGNRGINIIDGNLYFWDHFGGGTHYLKSYEGGYAIYNLSGGVNAVSTDVRINNTGNSSGKVPQKYIPVAQGFFVTALNDGQIQFKNSQRIFKTEKEIPIVSQFLKSAGKVKSSKETAEAEDVFPRIYLNYSSPKGFHRQLLVAFIPNTSDGIDIGYDAINGETFVEDMSWKANEKKLVIQAVPTLNEQRILPLYLKLAIDGIAKIGVDIVENMPRATKIFIKDNTTGETFDITEKPFEILLKAGVYDNRFAITFKVILVPDENAVLMNEDILVTVKNPLIAEDVSMVQNEQPVNIGIHVFMNNSISELQINNVTNSEILNINLFNNVGQLVNSWNTNLNKRDISLPVHTATGIYNVQITTKNGTTVKKIIIE